MSAPPRPPVNRLRRRLTALAATSLLGLPAARGQSASGTKRVVLGVPPAFAIPAQDRQRLRQAMARRGFDEGRNLRFEEAPLMRLPAETAESQLQAVIASRPDAIFTGFAGEVFLLRHLTRNIPIVFTDCPVDPARAGLVRSLGQPGGNLTGHYVDFPALTLKRWALYKQVLPSLSRGGLLRTTQRSKAPAWKNREAATAYIKGTWEPQQATTATAQRELGLSIVDIEVPEGATEEQLIEAVRRVRPQAIVLAVHARPDGPFNKFLVSERILNDRVVRAGYVSDDSDQAIFDMLGRILAGESPARIPVLQERRYVVKANLRLAKEMGFTLPPNVLAEAEVVLDH